MSQLGDEWVPGPEGLRYRKGARVLLFDGAGRILLQLAHDVDEPSRSWWFTPGGGILPGEDPREAAVRELFEETAIRIGPEDLIGPVATRTAIFDFLRENVRQDEVFYLTELPVGATVDYRGLSDLERQFIDRQEWIAIDQIPRLTAEVFPNDLAWLLTELADGWDGQTRVLEAEDRRTR